MQTRFQTASDSEAGTAGRVALVTGITGQDGSYLAEFLLAKGYLVHGIKQRSSSFNTGRVDHLFDASIVRMLRSAYANIAEIATYRFMTIAGRRLHKQGKPIVESRQKSDAAHQTGQPGSTYRAPDVSADMRGENNHAIDRACVHPGPPDAVPMTGQSLASLSALRFPEVERLPTFIGERFIWNIAEPIRHEHYHR